MTTIYYDDFSFNKKRFNYAYTDIGLCFIGSPDYDINEIYQFLTIDKLIKKPNSSIKKELLDYLTGNLKAFNLPIDLSWASDFQKSVYSQLKKIPYGQTTSYSTLAQAMNHSTATRAVASAVAKNPILFLIPCHRVIRKNGLLGGYRGGLELKKELLELERS